MAPRGLADHRALELTERAANLKHQPAAWRRCVDRLLIEVQVAAARVQVLDGAKQIDQAAGNAVNRPGHHDIEPAALRVLQHAVEPGPILAGLGAANPDVNGHLLGLAMRVLHSLLYLPLYCVGNRNTGLAV